MTRRPAEPATRTGPTWHPSESAALDDFGDVPLVVIGQDPHYIFLNPRFVETFGRRGGATPQRLLERRAGFLWRTLDRFPVGTATGTGMDRTIWDRPDLIVQEVMNVLNQVGSE